MPQDDVAKLSLRTPMDLRRMKLGGLAALGTAQVLVAALLPV